MPVHIIFCLGLLAVLLGACGTSAQTIKSTPVTKASISATPTPVRAFHTTLKTSDGVFLVQFAMTPHHFGPNKFIIDLKNIHNGQSPADEQVQIFTTMLDMDMGTGVVMLSPDGNGRYSAQGTLPMDGTWDLHIQLVDKAVHVAKLRLYVPA